MKREEFEQFAEMIGDVMGFYDKALSPTQAAMFFRLLSGHQLHVVRAALDAHARDPQRGRFAPTPADVVAQIEAAMCNDGRPGPEEAWALAMRAKDDMVTVVWSEETAAAWGACRVLMKDGDDIGARMTFKEVYTRLVAEARRKREPARWSVSYGSSDAMRDEALRLAVESGRLPQAYLPAPNAAPAAPVAGLLELSERRGCPADVREKLLAIRAQLVLGQGSPDAADRERTARLKQQAAERAAERADSAADVPCQLLGELLGRQASASSMAERITEERSHG